MGSDRIGRGRSWFSSTSIGQSRKQRILPVCPWSFGAKARCFGAKARPRRPGLSSGAAREADAGVQPSNQGYESSAARRRSWAAEGPRTPTPRWVTTGTRLWCLWNRRVLETSYSFPGKLLLLLRTVLVLCSNPTNKKDLGPSTPQSTYGPCLIPKFFAK